MAKVLLKRYLNASKEDNYDLEDEFAAPGDRTLSYVNYDVEVVIELDTETLDTKIVGCAGKLLSDESYETKEFYQLAK